MALKKRGDPNHLLNGSPSSKYITKGQLATLSSHQCIPLVPFVATSKLWLPCVLPGSRLSPWEWTSTRMSRGRNEVDGSMVTVVNGIFHLLINSVYIIYIGVISDNPLILTIDPNFLPRGHPSSWLKPGSLPLPEMVPEMVDFLGLPFLFAENISSLKLTFLHLKIGGWKMMWLPFGAFWSFFRGVGC